MGSASSEKEEGVVPLSFAKVRFVEAIDPDNPKEKVTHMVTTVPVTSKLAYERWAESIRNVDNPSLLLPLRHSLAAKGFCSTGGEVTLEYEDFSYDLDVEIKSRMAKGQSFSLEETYYTLFSLLEAGAQGERANCRVGDIQPRSVLLNGVGNIKIVSQLSYPEAGSSYERLYQGSSVFCSPEELAQARAKRPLPTLNFSIADCFSVGVTLLQLVTMRDCQELYDYHAMTFNWERAKSLLEQARASSVPELVGLVECMLRPEHSRPSCGEMLALLLPYESQIFDFKPFKIDPKRAQTSSKEYRGSVLRLAHFQGYDSRERGLDFLGLSPRPPSLPQPGFSSFGQPQEPAGEGGRGPWKL